MTVVNAITNYLEPNKDLHTIGQITDPNLTCGLAADEAWVYSLHFPDLKLMSDRSLIKNKIFLGISVPNDANKKDPLSSFRVSNISILMQISRDMFLLLSTTCLGHYQVLVVELKISSHTFSTEKLQYPFESMLFSNHVKALS